ncbi:ATP-dependent DNA helicase Q-like protein SIM isoform X2 [Cinnamomum micranthum f. kanehirae]|uniref:ATP-dependent DNA helicase n=1 Tax=Cinnamomum micranthum f. kanehirae TaxID=337451 RepID=A0A443NDJ3_9MAGN|nr:ATP-dependent DNA helicase Q-like protein SIM isoform X2 [Cinnamomum micranthum f. kanehirae]
MDGNDVAADYVIAELVDMGFEFPTVIEAIEAVGPCLDDAVEYILKGSCDNKSMGNGRAMSSYDCSTSEVPVLGKRSACSRSQARMKQSSIMEHVKSSGRAKKNTSDNASIASASGLENSKSRHMEDQKGSIQMNHELAPASESHQYELYDCSPHAKLEASSEENGLPLYSSDEQKPELNWEEKANHLVQKHFGFSSVKGFQKEALEAWFEHQDCLVLAATGSGKSLCFQIPALLTGKVVIVISPLISLMHDQCLKLARHGVSACFLGSGQTDSTVERKAMNGMYGIVYVCPETILRLIQPLQRLAENRGIALFAIDEVHCVSKWGHDFRPDYRRLSVLRENFKKYDIPLMALTATATIHVREDILKSLHMSKETKIVLTSFFRPNLRFSVKHSRTSCRSSYDKDFHELIDTYTSKGMAATRKPGTNVHDSEHESDSSDGSANGSMSDADDMYPSDSENSDSKQIYGNGSEGSTAKKKAPAVSKKNILSVEYLEDELDICDSVDDLDVTCGEFDGHSLARNQDSDGPFETVDPLIKPDERLKDLQEPLGQGPTIIYVPTRKETLRIAEYLCKSGVKAAAYHAKLPKSHLRRVHQEFHQNILEVVVATIAFGMGIDKSNVRRIIHYGWPQSLEAYYQEAGRAGRDGKLADCTLYADLSRIPSLLPSQRSEEQTKNAYKMLSDCFRYGMATASCRAKTLVKYFGEDFRYDKCLLCDVCVLGPPELQNMKAEADIFMQVLAAQRGSSYGESSYDDAMCYGVQRGRLMERPNLKMVVSRIREQFQQFAASDRLRWQGLARILQDKGYIREGDDMIRVSIKYPELTELGLRFLSSEIEQSFFAYPEADMLLSTEKRKSYSTFAEWGRGWADPEIRRQRLQGRNSRRKKRKKRTSKNHQDPRTVRGRLTAKLLKQKR